jgi:hypothetical protein
MAPTKELCCSPAHNDYENPWLLLKMNDCIGASDNGIFKVEMASQQYSGGINNLISADWPRIRILAFLKPLPVEGELWQMRLP